MTETDSFKDVMNRLRAGDQSAAREIFQRFVGQLVRLAREKFNGVLRHRIDPEDVVQSAYKSFFLRYGEGQFEVRDWGNLWGLLTLITLRKCVDRVEYHRAEKRDVRREAAAHQGSEGSEPWWEAVARDPTPEEATLLIEAVEVLLRSLDEAERPILQMSLQGFTTQDIANHLNRPERSVRRVRETIRKRLEAMQFEE
jgi:RNA polymerase sigma-70 factor (ECF subfamily)